MKKVVVVGSLNMDLVVKTESLPKPGETVAGKNFYTFPGGKGANQAVAIAKLGAEVFHVGKIGKDSFGKALVASLQNANVNTDHIETSESEPTGVALITVNQSGGNTIVVVPGANAECKPVFVENAIRNIDDDILVLQLEIPLPSVKAAIQAAKHRGMVVVFNPAPAAKLPPEIFPAIDILVLNETETEFILNQVVTDSKSALIAGGLLVSQSINEVIITLGKNGAIYASRQDAFFVPCFKVKSVDATAAGDSFIGGLVASLASGKNIRDALHFASAAAALTVTKMGAQASLPIETEVTTFLTTRRCK